MFMEVFASLSNFSPQKIRHSDPEKYNSFVQSAVNLTEIGVELLRESPEFREAFARIHNEFLKYPESRSTIEQAYSAQQYFAPQIWRDDTGGDYTNPYA